MSGFFCVIKMSPHPHHSVEFFLLFSGSIVAVITSNRLNIN